MNTDQLDPAFLQSHLLRMRLTAAVFFATAVAAAAVIFVVPHRGGSPASPATVTGVAVVAGLWVGFTANRDANDRLERIRRAAAVHGDDRRLLRDHWIVYLLVLVRLEILVIAGVVVALWGVGAGVGVWLILLSGLMIALTWPSLRKTRLLLGRVRALRESG